MFGGKQQVLHGVKATNRHPPCKRGEQELTRTAMERLVLAAVASVIAINAAQAQLPRAYRAEPPRAYTGNPPLERADLWQCGLIPRPSGLTRSRFQDRPDDWRPEHAVHTSISGVTRVRSEQYHVIRVWDDGNANWSGVSMENLRVTMIGTFGKNQMNRRMQYVERIYRDGLLKATIVSTRHYVEGE
jgi:hypothetical protein